MAEPSEQTPPVVEDGAAKPIDQDPEVAPLAADEDVLSKKVTLADLSAKGAALYAHKQYEEATEIFSRASILQAEINGETAPENAEILFHYGRSLFKVGQSKSDVLGGPAAADKKKKTANGNAKPKKSAAAGAAEPAKTEAEKVTQEGVAIIAEQKDAEKEQKTEAKEESNAKKPLFQFTGDENFDEDSDEDEVR